MSLCVESKKMRYRH